MTTSESRAALEGATPPPAPAKSRREPELGESLGAVNGVGSDQVYVTVVTDPAGDARVCLMTSWDNDAETASSVVLDAQGVESLIDLLSAYRPYVGNVCVAHLIIDCEECAGELESSGD
jgi:hypothetical protein